MFSSTYVKDEKLWYGPDIPSLYNPEINMAQALLHGMSTFGSKIAQISDNNDIQMTFDEIRTKTIRAAQNLQARGYKPKQTFVLLSRNDHHVAPIVFASLAIGCPLNCLDASFTKTELIHMLKTTVPTVVFCQFTCYELLVECLAEVSNSAKVFVFGDNHGQCESVENLFLETHREREFIPVKVDGINDTAMIVCSSGTTGLSKGVCLSHASLLDTTVCCRFGNSDDIMLCFSSLYWISGLIVLLTGTLFGATRLITTQVFSPALYLRMIEQYKATFSFNAPHQIGLILNHPDLSTTDLSSLKYQFIGGSKVPFHAKTDFNRYLSNGRVHVVFGLSESGGFLTIDNPASDAKDTIGRLIMGGSCAKVVDDDGNRCGVNVDGELCFKVPYKFIGYLNNQQATDDMIDAEGFIKTGDIGRFDEHGDLYHTGRKKELMKYFGFQIAPSEIDAYLTESPDIESACVAGIPDAMGDQPAAVIVRANGSNITEADVANLVAGHFSDHCKLRGGVYFVKSLPTTPSGKVLRNKVKEMIIEFRNANKG